MIKLISAIWNYCSDVWQGDDGKLSLKRLMIMGLIVEIFRLIELNRLTTEYMLSAFYAILGTVIVTLGIITVAQLQSLKSFTFTKSTQEQITGPLPGPTGSGQPPPPTAGQ